MLNAEQHHTLEIQIVSWLRQHNSADGWVELLQDMPGDLDCPFLHQDPGSNQGDLEIRVAIERLIDRGLLRSTSSHHVVVTETGHAFATERAPASRA